LCACVCVCVRLPGVEPRCTFGMEGRDTPQALLGREGPAVIIYISFLFSLPPAICPCREHFSMQTHRCGYAKTANIRISALARPLMLSTPTSPSPTTHTHAHTHTHTQLPGVEPRCTFEREGYTPTTIKGGETPQRHNSGAKARLSIHFYYTQCNIGGRNRSLYAFLK
jgi:hypothetical protein